MTPFLDKKGSYFTLSTEAQNQNKGTENRGAEFPRLANACSARKYTPLKTP
jgi:hypothetical protein